MSAIKETIDIARSPAEVYSYVTDPSHIPEWQQSAVSVMRMSDAPMAVGSRVSVTRRMGKREFTSTMEVTEMDPPRSWHLHGVDGPVRADVQGRIEPIENGAASRLTIDLDFEGHGMGRALVPFVVRPAARREMPLNEAKLKTILERGAV
ncbi:SRPBCC family protein [Streptomyces sp. NPDC051211]|uniref:SRPBCC family protein n=1 Tax=Streptomyces sp. NPDC051211 TaxID=3154643 RepID=UPI00344D7078